MLKTGEFLHQSAGMHSKVHEVSTRLYSMSMLTFFCISRRRLAQHFVNDLWAKISTGLFYKVKVCLKTNEYQLIRCSKSLCRKLALEVISPNKACSFSVQIFR